MTDVASSVEAFFPEKTIFPCYGVSEFRHFYYICNIVDGHV